MLISINKVIVKDRIRKDLGDLTELAEDIKENGLINPPVVTPDFELIAGERRLRAMEKLGYQQIQVRVMKVNDYEHMLNLEINENENRKDFTKSERIQYARQLEKIERMKAKERQVAGVDLSQNSDEGGRTDEVVAEKLGIGSRDTYRKEKYIEENADKKTLEQWDREDISTHKAYTRIRKLEKEVETYKHQQDLLREENEGLKNRGPQVIEKEVTVEVVPEEYKNLKSNKEELEQQLRDLKREFNKQQSSEQDFNKLRKEYEKKVNESHDLQKQIEQLVQVDSKVKHQEKLKDSALMFSTKIHTFLNDVGGLAWLTEYIDDLDDYDKRSYLKALDLLEGWVLTVKSNINKEEF